jgi:hypothetical protein
MTLAFDIAQKIWKILNGSYNVALIRFKTEQAITVVKF